MEQNHDHVPDGGLLTDKEALVLTLRHQDTVVDPDQAALLHLERKPALPPGVAQGQFGWPSVILKDDCLAHSVTDHHFHAEIEQFGVAVLHFELAKQLPNQLTTVCLEAYTQCFVFNVRTET